MTIFKRTYSTKKLMEDTLSPSEFLKLSDLERENIRSTQIVPPKLGQRHFGKIKIVRKTPVYAVTE